MQKYKNDNKERNPDNHKSFFLFFTKILLIANLESYSNKLGFRLNRTFGFSQNTNLEIYGLKLIGCQLNYFLRKT
jgi:hypothetical protein